MLQWFDSNKNKSSLIRFKCNFLNHFCIKLSFSCAHMKAENLKILKLSLLLHMEASKPKLWAFHLFNLLYFHNSRVMWRLNKKNNPAFFSRCGLCLRAVCELIEQSCTYLHTNCKKFFPQNLWDSHQTISGYIGYKNEFLINFIETCSVGDKKVYIPEIHKYNENEENECSGESFGQIWTSLLLILDKCWQVYC